MNLKGNQLELIKKKYHIMFLLNFRPIDYPPSDQRKQDHSTL